VLSAGAAALILAVAACSSGGSSGNAGGNGSSVLTMASDSPWTTVQYDPWATTGFPGAAAGFVYLPLAVQNYPSLTSFTPELATSWSVQGNKLIVKLQPTANWQDGKPVTSTDVIDTLYLDGVDGNPIWDDIAAVSAAGPKEVVLTAPPGVPMVLLEDDLLTGVTPYPASVWGKYLTPSLENDVVTYFSQVRGNPNAAASSSAGTAISAALQNLAKASPATLVGDGPYKLAGINTQETKLVKWDGFYDASRITIHQINYFGLAQPDVNSALLSGQADFSSGWLYMPPVIVQSWLQTSNAHLAAVLGQSQTDVIFNDHEYPFTDTTVRQALAYAFPIEQMDDLAWGTVTPHAVAPNPPDGLLDPDQAQFLTSSQVNSLNPYHYSPSKAAALLRSAGFHKSGKWWIMPNGQRFTLTLSINANWTDQIGALKVAASSLTGFGIQTTLSTVESTTYLNDEKTGNFQVAADCCYAAADPNPLVQLANSPMGSGEDYPAAGSYKGDRGIGFGPVADVPGLGNVNVPQTLEKEAQTVGVGPEMNTLTWDWARFVDEQVPYLEFADFTNQIAFSTNRFDWPATSDPIWTRVSNSNYVIIEAEENGSLRPK
jgi:peptide/nickel transport system substrate-binding protein